MDQRLRGKGNYSFDEIIAYSSKKDDWIELERRLKINYSLERIIINDSKSAGCGINYRVGKNSLCYIHPEINALFIAFQIKEEVIENIKSRLSDYALKVWDNRYPCGNGGWMWYRLTETNQIDEVILLLNNKIKHKNKKRL